MSAPTLRKLVYGTTTSLAVTIGERFLSAVFPLLYFADSFNAFPNNPPSSNPFQLYLDYAEIVRTNDVLNPKFVSHKRGVRFGIRKALGPSHPQFNDAMKTVDRMGIKALQPYLAILDLEVYEHHHKTKVNMLLPNATGSPTSSEYRLESINGPSNPEPDIHLLKLHF